jgi:hypothetical protein
MPRGRAALSSATITTTKDWIAGGAPKKAEVHRAESPRLARDRPREGECALAATGQRRTASTAPMFGG